MVLSERQLLLLDFVKLQHGEQKRKYTHEPYWNHLLAVAEIVSEYESRGVEIALCHDLFEDTKCTSATLHTNLLRFGYERRESYTIVTCAKELTDVYTSDAHPYMNRKKRKAEEAKRLGTISSVSQSVKYADIIDNTVSIVQHDKGFAKVYLLEIKEMLSVMRGGNPALLSKCELVVEDAALKLNSAPITN